MKRSAVPLLVATVLLAGCGGGGGDDTTEARPPSTTTAPVSTAPGAPTTTSATSRPDDPTTKADDRALAEAGLLVRADLPAGWEEGEPSGDVRSPCPAIAAAKRATSVRRSSNTFTLRGGEIASNVYVYGTPAEAQRNMESFGSDSTLDCVGKQALSTYVAAAKRTAGAKAELRGTSRPALTDGDDRRVLRATIAYTTQGRTVDFPFSVAVVRVGRALAVVGLTAVPDPGMQNVTTRVVRRLTAAQAAGR